MLNAGSMSMTNKLALRVQDLSVRFPVRTGMLGQNLKVLSAVEGVTFSLASGESLGIVGESGCGKTTLALAIAGLGPISEGHVEVEGVPYSDAAARRNRRLRRKVQVVFQDPMSSLNPRMTIGDIVGEPLRVHKIGTRNERARRVTKLLEQVGLRSDHASRYPHELSGGQRQRVGLARALALDPGLIVADEPVSALDVSVKAQIINLLADIRAHDKRSFLVISHDFSIIEYLCDRVAVMYLGKIVEMGRVKDVLLDPQHPYTRSLIAAIPSPRRQDVSGAVPSLGELPSPLDPPSGCRFHPRCPVAVEKCSLQEPKFVKKSSARFVACHLLDGQASIGEDV